MSTVVVLVGGICAREPITRCRRIAWRVSPLLSCPAIRERRRIGAIAEDEVAADDPAVLAERDSERGLRRGVLQAGDEQAGRDPATFE